MTQFTCILCNNKSISYPGAHLQAYHKEYVIHYFTKNEPKIEDPDKSLFSQLNDRIEGIDTALKGLMAVPGGPIAMSHKEYLELESKVTSLRSGHNYRFDKLEETTQKRLKDLENKWLDHTDWIEDMKAFQDLKLKVKELEEWKEQEHINKSTDTALAKAWMQDIMDLKEKVKDLEEETIKNTTHTHNQISSDVFHLLRRVKDLEEWTQNHRTGYFTPEIVQAHNDRIKALEEQNKQRQGVLRNWEEGIKTLDNYARNSVTHLESRLDGIDTTLQVIDKRIENLENVIGRIHSVKFKDIEKKLQELEYEEKEG
jgi:hypothetical protein